MAPPHVITTLGELVKTDQQVLCWTLSQPLKPDTLFPSPLHTSWLNTLKIAAITVITETLANQYHVYLALLIRPSPLYFNALIS